MLCLVFLGRSLLCKFRNLFVHLAGDTTSTIQTHRQCITTINKNTDLQTAPPTNATLELAKSTDSASAARLNQIKIRQQLILLKLGDFIANEFYIKKYLSPIWDLALVADASIVVLRMHYILC